MPALPSLPALSKAYCTYANIPFTQTSTTAQVADSWVDLLVQALTNTLTTGTLTGTRHPNSVWSVHSSSNWTRPYIRAALPATRSWIILYNANVGLYLLVDHYTATIGQLRLAVAPYVPTANTLMARNTGMVAQGANGDDGGGYIIWPVTAGGDWNAHITLTDDGQFFFFVNKVGGGFFASGSCVTRLYNSSYPWPWMIMGGITGPSSADPTYEFGQGWPARLDSSLFICAPLADTANNGLTGSFLLAPGGLDSYAYRTRDYLSNQRYAYPITLHSIRPTGYAGVVPDCYFTIGVSPGRLFPNSTSPTHISVNNALLPYVGAAPNL